MPDPNLEAFREKLKLLCAEHDVACIANAASQTHAIYSLNLAPTWSCLELETNSIRFNTLKFPAAQRQQATHDTINMVMGMNDSLTALQEQLQLVTQMLGQRFTISHTTRKEPPLPPTETQNPTNPDRS